MSNTSDTEAEIPRRIGHEQKFGSEFSPCLIENASGTGRIGSSLRGVVVTEEWKESEIIMHVIMESKGRTNQPEGIVVDIVAWKVATDGQASGPIHSICRARLGHSLKINVGHGLVKNRKVTNGCVVSETNPPGNVFIDR